MKHRMITILGKVKSAEHKDYRTTDYQFNEDTIKTASYFGLALNEIVKPDEIIVLGTKGSMWDNLFMQIEGFENQYTDEILTLNEQAQKDEVCKDLLEQMAKNATEKLGISYRCELISYADTETKQVELIEQLTNLFDENDEATLDVTHGLRHLPLLIQQVAQLLPLIKNVTIKGVYYGALDLSKDQKTPVMRLDGLQLINDWDTAFSLYHETGNVAAFCSALEKTKVEKSLIRHLKSAAFFTQTNRTPEAKREVKAFLGLIDNNKEHLPAVFKLFLPKLKSQLEWINANNNWQQRGKLALQSLDNADYLRASLFGYEAFISRLIEHLDIADDQYNERGQKIRSFLNENDNKHIKKEYSGLNSIRNAVAHGFIESSDSRYQKETEKILANEKKLKHALRKYIDFLLKVTL